MNCINLFGRLTPALISVLLFIITGNPGISQTPLTFDQTINPATIGPGSSTKLTFTISNPNVSLPVTDIAFTNSLPASMLISTPANVSTNCVGLVVDASPGGSTIDVSNGRLGGGASCSVSLLITSSVAGTHTNTTGVLSSSLAPGSTSAADLTVDADRPGFSKSFAPAEISPGASSRLIFVVDNSASSTGISAIDFSDQLPGNLVVASPSNATTNCNFLSGSFNPVPGSNIVSASLDGFPILTAGSSCTFQVDVTSATPASLTNISGELLTAESGTFGDRTSGIAAANLNVRNQVLTKSFTTDPVAPGSSVILRFNLNNLDDQFSGRPGFGDYTNIAFSDDLELVLPGTDDLIFNSVVSNTCGGSISGAGTDLFSFSGGSLTPGTSCSIRISLNVDSSTPIGTYSNTTSTVNYDVGGDNITGNSASDNLVVRADPVLTTEFLDATALTSDPVLAGGDNVVIRYSIQNTSPTSTATEINFLNDLTQILPFPIVASTPSTPCGPGSSVSVVNISTERQGIALTGGELAGGASCSFDVTLTLPIDITQGVYNNKTEEIKAIVDGQNVTGKPASDDLLVATAPSLVKVFSLNQVAPGDQVDLTYTLDHGNNAPGPASNIEFTDDFGSLITSLGTVGSLSTGTCDGSLSETGGVLTYTGGSLPVDGSCAFTVTLDVPTTAPSGQYISVTSDVTAVVTAGGGNVDVINVPSSDVLEVLSLTLSKEFTNDPVVPGTNANLSFTITNETSQNLTDISFSDDLDDVLDGLVATGLPQTNVCGTGSQIIGTSNLTFVGGNLGPNASCTFNVTVSIPASTLQAEYTNLTSVVTAKVDGNSVTAPAAEDKLIVASAPNLLTLSKSFSPNPAAPGEEIDLNFDITYVGSANATNISFTDNLNSTLAGLTATSLPANGFCGTSSTITGSGLLSISGAELAPGQDCSFSVTVKVPDTAADGDYTNTTSQITATGINGNIATDVLSVVGNIIVHAPEADAGTDQTIECPASTTLDGSESVGFALDPLIYTWVESGDTIAMGVNPTVTLDPGIYTITLFVKDSNGEDSDDVVITVEDTAGPNITSCPGDITVNTDIDECFASGVDLGTATATDACGTVVSITNDAPATFPVGSTTVTYTATDNSGNMSTCTQMVTIADNELPVINCPANVTVNTDFDECFATGVGLGSASATDACGIASISNDAPSVFPLGETDVTWTAIDNNGNVATCIQIVLVEDNQLPEIMCPEDITVCEGEAIVIGNATASDNCDLSPAITNNDPGSYPVGTTTITWTATDASGNTVTCDQTITVNPNPTVSISSSELPELCQGNYIELTATGSTAGTLLWSTMETTETIQVTNSGTYSVEITDSNGCVGNDNITVTVNAEDLLSAYIIIATEKDADFKEAVILNGGVGVMDADGEAKFDKDSDVTGATTFVKAPEIDVKGGSSVTTQIIGVPSITLPPFINNTSGGGADIKIKKNEVVTLSGSVYGKIDIDKEAVVTFTSSDISVEDLKIKKEAIVYFDQCAEIKIEKHLHIDDDVSFNSGMQAVTIYAEKADIKDGVSFFGDIYTTKDIKVSGKDGNPTFMTGLFIGEDVKSDKEVVWDWNTNCDCIITSPLLSDDSETGTDIISDVLRTDEIQINLFTDPNPFEESFRMNGFIKSSETQTRVIVTNLQQQEVFRTTIYSGAIDQNIDASDWASGMYLLTVISGNEHKTIKLIKTQ